MDQPVPIIGMVLASCFLAGAIITFVFYLISLQKAFNRCGPENRAMHPGLVWLLFIPCFSPVWHFFVVINLAKSLDAEFKQRAIAENTQVTKIMGIIMCSLWCAMDGCQVLGLIPLLGLPFIVLGILTGFALVVCWIIYWVLFTGLSRKLVP